MLLRINFTHIGDQVLGVVSLHVRLALMTVVVLFVELAPSPSHRYLVPPPNCVDLTTHVCFVVQVTGSITVLFPHKVLPTAGSGGEVQAKEPLAFFISSPMHTGISIVQSPLAHGTLLPQRPKAGEVPLQSSIATQTAHSETHRIETGINCFEIMKSTPNNGRRRNLELQNLNLSLKHEFTSHDCCLPICSKRYIRD